MSYTDMTYLIRLSPTYGYQEKLGDFKKETVKDRQKESEKKYTDKANLLLNLISKV